jgi:hypothetical protein
LALPLSLLDVVLVAAVGVVEVVTTHRVVVPAAMEVHVAEAGSWVVAAAAEMVTAGVEVAAAAAVEVVAADVVSSAAVEVAAAAAVEVVAADVVSSAAVEVVAAAVEMLAAAALEVVAAAVVEVVASDSRVVVVGAFSKANLIFTSCFLCMANCSPSFVLQIMQTINYKIMP